jgi:tetratricopeptide (TPR) repeat protein
MTRERGRGDEGRSSEPADPEALTRADAETTEPRPFWSAEPGDVLADRYRIVELLGQGAMGVVFEAEDQELGGRVALKILRPELARDRNTEDRFRREVHLARRVTHPNVCRIYDLGRHWDDATRQELVFLTMELLRGHPLSHRLSLHGAMEPEAALEIAEPIAAALNAAHAAGVIHRDFKGANVMLGPSERGRRVVVTDFGLSRSLDEADPHRLTATGKILGTPAFIAPEQLTGEPITPAVDIYAFGVLLFQMVTGELPFSGGGPLAAALRRLKEPPPDPASMRPDLPDRWSRVILRCLSRDPAHRYRTAGEVVAALRAPSDTAPSPLEAAEPKATAAVRPWLRWAIGTLIVLGGASLGWLVGQRPADPLAEHPVAGAAEGERPSVALVGFSARSPDSEPWIGEVAGELLLRELAAGDRVRIASPFETLNADGLLLDGTYRQVESGALALEARVRRGTTTLAQESVQGREADVLELVADLASRLRASVALDPSPEELQTARAARPPAPEAARAYGQGLALLHELRLAEARESLEQAVTTWPEFPLAWAALAETYRESGMDARARAAAEEARSRSSPLPRRDQLLIDARYRESRSEWNEARRIHEALVRFYPDEPEHAIRLAEASRRSGYAREALSTLQTLGARHPEDPRILLALADLHEALGHHDDTREVARRAGEQAGTLSAWGLQGRALVLEAQVVRIQGDFDAASALLDRADGSFRRAKDAKGVADLWTARSRVDVARGAYDAALDHLRQASQRYEGLGDEAGVAATWLAEGAIARRTGDLARAGELYERARARYESLGHFPGAYSALRNLAILRSVEGQLPEARRMFEQALNVANATGNRAHVAAASNNLAIVLSDSGEQQRAAELYEAALEGFRDVGDLDGAGSALNNLAILRWDRGELAAASRAYEEALGIYREMRDPSGEALVRANLAELWRDRGDLDRAESLLKEALAGQEEIGETPAAAKTRALLALLELDRGRPAPAARQALEATAALDELPDDAALAWAITALARFAAGDDEGAAAAFEEASRRADRRENPAIALWVAIARARTLGRGADPGSAALALEALAEEAHRAEIRRLELVARSARAAALEQAGQEKSSRELAGTVGREADAIGFRSPELRPEWPGGRG